MQMKMFAVAATLVLGGCMTQGMDDGAVAEAPSRGAQRARVTLNDARGRGVASAQMSQEAAGVRVRVAATAMPAGTYAAHVHMVGRCDAPAFESAGGHWNPTGQQHGRDNPAGAHLGDLPNLSVGTDGRGSMEYLAAGARLDGGTSGMFDTDGSALIIHANADDYRTDPSGNSGVRIACGIVR